MVSGMSRGLAELSFRLAGWSPGAFVRYLRALPPTVPERLRRSAFRATLRWVNERSDFYRQRFAQCGVDPLAAGEPSDLGGFYLGPEQLRENPERLLCAEPQLAIESSGTTGHASRIYLSQAELDYNARQAVLLRAVYGLSRDDRILSTFDYGFCLDGQLAQRSAPHWKCFAMCVGRADPLDAYRRLKEYKFNIVMSGAPWLARFTEVAEQEGRPFPLKLLVGGGGGGIMPRTRAGIENFWQAPLCMTYGLTEAATLLGFECLERDGYHLNEFDFYVEIADPDPEGYGELVVTTVNRRVMPLIRYRTKDVARLLEGECRCGLPLTRLSPLRGRLDEIAASVWGNVHPDFFSAMLAPIPGLAEDWQIVLEERDGKQTFSFRLELENGNTGQEAVKTEIFAALKHEHPLAWNACEQKLAGVEFVFLPKGTLRKGRKLLRLVDRRRARTAL